MSRPKQIITALLLIIILTTPALLALTKPGFFPTQDYIYVARIYEMDKALKDGQFPVRWVPDFRYGEPLFNFYAPLPYYVGSFIHTIGFSFLVTTKILFALGFLLSAVAMFFLARKLFNSWAGVVSAMMYIYAPYHSVDVYVRGALSEGWALIFFPLIFLFSLRIKEKSNLLNTWLLGLSLAGLFLTHNIMTMLFGPFIILWWIFLSWQAKQARLVKSFLISLGLGISLAASFLFPAFFEKSFVQSDKLISGYFDFRAHFVTLKQFFLPFWGYGGSTWGDQDGMSFQVGIIHWIMFVLTLVLTLIQRQKKLILLNLFLVALFLLSLFMQHNRSTIIWIWFPLLSYTQFPWRFLGISIFIVSLISGLFIYHFSSKRYLSLILTALIVLAVVTFNLDYFHPESYYLDSKDEHYISSKTLSIEDRLPKDYLPIWVKEINKERITSPQVTSGNMRVLDYQKRSVMASVIIDASEEGKILLPITYFPGWRAWLGSEEMIVSPSQKLGLIEVKLSKNNSFRNKNLLKLKFTDTPIRLIGNLLSFAAIVTFLGLSVKKIREKCI